jgi:MFS family permease
MLVALELAPRAAAPSPTEAADAPPRHARWSRRELLVRLVPLGVLVGLAAATRFIGGLLGPAALTVACAAAPRGQRWRTLRWTMALVPALSLLVFIAVWPLLWRDPIGNLLASWSTLRRPHGAEPFGGQLTTAVPWSYFLQYLGATAPVGVLVAAALGVAEQLRRRRALALVTLAAWLGWPLLVSVSPVRQDGVRYVLPALAALSLAAGMGVAAALTWLRAGWRRGALGAVGAAYLALICARIQPYYLDYYNELVGGPAAVSRARRFETAWWGEGLDRAISYINAHAQPGASVHRGCVVPSHLTWFRGDLWAPLSEDARRAEWIVVYAPDTRPCALPPAAQLRFTVRAQGAALAQVWQQPPGR